MAKTKGAKSLVAVRLQDLIDNLSPNQTVVIGVTWAKSVGLQVVPAKPAVEVVEIEKTERESPIMDDWDL